MRVKKTMINEAAAKEKIEEALLTADGLYHRLILLVGENRTAKSKILAECSSKLKAKIVNVNLEISRLLINSSTRQRVTRLPEILEDVIDKSGKPAFLDNLEVLFDRTLQQDPLRLLLGISRNRTVVATWTGAVTNGYLSYAELGHPEYRKYDAVDALIINVDK